MLCPICNNELQQKKPEYIKPNGPTMFCPNKCKNHKGFNISEWDAVPGQTAPSQPAQPTQSAIPVPPVKPAFKSSFNEELSKKQTAMNCASNLIAAQIKIGIVTDPSLSQSVKELAGSLYEFLNQ